MFYAIVLITYCASSAVVSLAERQVPQVQNIAFDLPDVTTKIQVERGQAQLEAFKSLANDRILNLNECRLPERNSQLFWVSIGYPKLLAHYDVNGTAQGFQRRSDGFLIEIELLTEEQSAALAEAASIKYSIPVAPRQIVYLPLSKLHCSIILYDFERVLIVGSTRSFQNNRLRVNFHAPDFSRERKLFEAKLAAQESIDIDCTLASQAKQVRINTLSISASEIQALRLTEKLFGPSHSMDSMVYVTREQLKMLAADLYSSLSILEDYEMPEHQFSSAFIDALVGQTASVVFNQVSLNDAISGLSKFGTDFSDDLRADDIRRDLGRVFNFSSFANKSHIVVNHEYLESLKQDSSSSSSFAAVGRFPLFSARASANFAHGSHSDWSKGTKSLNDQLRELNAAAKNEFEWVIEGKKVVPKSINVARLFRGNFSRTLLFSRVRRQLDEAAFVRTVVFELDSKSRVNTESAVLSKLDFSKKIESLRSELFNATEANLNATLQHLVIPAIEQLREALSYIGVQMNSTMMQLDQIKSKLREDGENTTWKQFWPSAADCTFTRNNLMMTKLVTGWGKVVRTSAPFPSTGYQEISFTFTRGTSTSYDFCVGVLSRSMLTDRDFLCFKPGFYGAARNYKYANAVGGGGISDTVSGDTITIGFSSQTKMVTIKKNSVDWVGSMQLAISDMEALAVYPVVQMHFTGDSFTIRP